MKYLLFCTKGYYPLAQELIQGGSFEEGKVEVRTFSDGERYQRILSTVEDRNVVLLGGAIDDSSTLEIYDLASAIVKYGANSLSMVLPYFAYSTMERAVKRGEVVTAKTRARLFSSIPRSNKGNRIYLFDLHTEGLPHYFENHLVPYHVYCKELIIQAAQTYGGKQFVLGSTDAGRAKWVESLANDMEVNAAFILKRRTSENTTEVTAVNADVENCTVIIYDDMIRSGGSIINAAKTYKNAGAKKIIVITTHGLFVDQGFDRLKQCGLIEKVICTNSHENATKIKDPFLEVMSIAPLIRKALHE